MDPNDNKTTIAWIYGSFVVLSAGVAYGLFNFLSSSAIATGSLWGFEFTAGGAIAGFIVIFVVLHVAYSRFVSKINEFRVSGNVLDEQNFPVSGATVSVDGHDMGNPGTDDNGLFQVRIEGRPPWTLRARKKGFEIAVIDIDRKQAKKPVRIQLKKKL